MTGTVSWKDAEIRKNPGVFAQAGGVGTVLGAGTVLGGGYALYQYLS